MISQCKNNEEAQHSADFYFQEIKTINISGHKFDKQITFYAFLAEEGKTIYFYNKQFSSFIRYNF